MHYSKSIDLTQGTFAMPSLFTKSCPHRSFTFVTIQETMEMGDMIVFSLFYSGCVRIFAGLLGDKSPVRRNILAGIAASYGGLLTVISLSFKTFPTLLTFAVLYAIGGGMLALLVMLIWKMSKCVFLTNGILNTGRLLCERSPEFRTVNNDSVTLTLIPLDVNPMASQGLTYNLWQCSGSHPEFPAGGR